MYVEDHFRDLDLIIRNGQIGGAYLISSENEKSKVEVVRKILNIHNADENLIKNVIDRPCHDLRYSMNPKKIIKVLCWAPEFDFEEVLKETVCHYKVRLHK